MTSWPETIGAYGSETPLYERVVLDLTTALFAEPPPCGRLPSEADLCERFGVSRTTLRRATGELEAQGLIVRRHGLGTFFVGGNVMGPCSEPVATMDLLRSIPGFNTRSLRVETIPPCETSRTRLSLLPAALVLHVRRLDCVGSTPIALVEAFLPTTILDSITEHQVDTESVYSLLGRHGTVVLRVDQTIYTEPWSEVDAKQVGASKGEYALVLERTTFSIGEAPVEFSILRFRPRRVRVEMSLSAGGRLDGPVQFDLVEA